MFTKEQLNALYDPKEFPDVSAKTRTDIIGAIAIDVESLTLNEGGTFTEEELCEGLRYLLATNKDLHTYLEKTSRSSNKNTSSSSHNPFYIPADHLLISYFLLNSTNNSGNSCVPNGYSSSGDNDKVLLFCLAIIALVIVIIFLYCIVKNTLSTIKSHEPNSVKAAKIILTLSILAATAVLTTYWLAPIASLFICITVVLFTATALAALVSYISSKFLYLPKIDPPKKELLDELQTVKQILEHGYDRPGDNKEQCKQFIKEVVRYYIQAISKKNNIELDQPHAAVTKIDPHIDPSASPLSVHNQQGYGTFFHESNSVSNKGPLISTEPLTCVNG